MECKKCTADNAPDQIRCSECGWCPGCGLYVHASRYENGVNFIGPLLEAYCECHRCVDCHTWLVNPRNEENREHECSNCGNCESCCGCSNCDKCALPYDSTCSNCDRCEGCCNCTHCNRCGEADNDLCVNCSCCQNHCECSSCSGCGGVYEELHNCDYCESCCDCEDDSESWISAKPNTWHGKVGRFLGVEIEVANGDKSKISPVIEKWGAGLVRDGSLPETGFEITTAPARGESFLKQIEEITKGLHEGKGKITRECGLHVHVDCRDFRYYEIRRIAKFYAAIEPALYAVLPAWRRQSKYCLPCGHLFSNLIVDSHKQVRKDIHKACYQISDCDRETSYRKKHKYDESRYFGLNIHSWFYRGTIEFRHFGGSMDYTKITNWAKLCCAIVEFAARAKDQEIDEMDLYLPAKNLRSLFSLVGDETTQWVQKRWAEKYSNGNVNYIRTMSDVRS